MTLGCLLANGIHIVLAGMYIVSQVVGAFAGAALASAVMTAEDYE